MPFPLIIPILALGAVAYLARSPRGPARPTPAQAIASGEVPSPLAVMSSYLAAGQSPPPAVIMCAIAEAESVGRSDLARQIVRVLVLPVVQAAEMAGARRQSVLHASRYAPDYYPPALPPGPPPAAQYAPHPDPASYPTPSPAAPPSRDADAGYVAAHSAAADAARPVAPPPRVELIRRDEPARAASAGTITVSGKSSPIDGVRTEEWSAFVGRVSRELPEFMAARHVGQFRQRRDRLEELGIDPDSVVSSPSAQLAALEVDMGDAYRHARASGMLDDHVGGVVVLPGPGGPGAHRVTRSGVLGVIQAAGLEGAVGWLESEADRVRFPGTTAAFLRTNGVF